MKLKKKEVGDEIPTSSMADIAFLLIIYFMLTTTFAATRGLDFALPEEDDSPPVIEPEDSVLVEILPGGNLMVDARPMPLGELLEYLRPKLDNNPKKPVIIKPDPTSPYGAMVDVFDELRQGKEKIDHEINVSIPTQREIDRFWL